MTPQGLLVPAALLPAVEGVQPGEARQGGLDVAAAQIGAGDFDACLLLGGGGHPDSEAVEDRDSRVVTAA